LTDFSQVSVTRGLAKDGVFIPPFEDCREPLDGDTGEAPPRFASRRSKRTAMFSRYPVRKLSLVTAP